MANLSPTKPLIPVKENSQVVTHSYSQSKAGTGTDHLGGESSAPRSTHYEYFIYSSVYILLILLSCKDIHSFVNIWLHCLWTISTTGSMTGELFTRNDVNNISAMDGNENGCNMSNLNIHNNNGAPTFQVLLILMTIPVKCWQKI